MKIAMHGRHRLVSQSETIYLVNWALEKLLGKRLANNIHIDFVYGIEDSKSSGLCDALYLEDRRQRFFEIQINPRMGRKKTIATIIHELVHVKQYARDELKHVGAKMNRWQGQDYPAGNYWDYPWEIEAYGREITMSEQYKEHLNEMGIKFN
jgi:hypothetical protein